jgi:polysaccharide deacetylase 2 family uncharacterized protein YibQ
LVRHRRLLASGLLALIAGLALSLSLSHTVKLALTPAPPTVLPPPKPEPVPEPPIMAQAEETPVPLPHEALAADPEEPAAPAAPQIALAPSPVPAWQAFAVPAKPGRAMVAVIIDDMGLDRRRSDKVVELPGPLTLSYMTYAPHAAQQTAEAHAHGHELMMHMPMQPLAQLDAGPDVLMDKLPPDELRRRVEADLDRFGGFVGVNNHMGSRFTAYAPGMRIVMSSLKTHGLLFIDSMTTDKSVGVAAAREAGVPVAKRNIFLDDIDDEAAVMSQLAKAEEQAKKAGSVIVIGHPHDHTTAALAAWLPTLAKKGLTLVPVTTIVAAREAVHGN